MAKSMPKVRAVIESEDGTLTEYELQLTFSDAVRFDVLRKRYGFPSREEAEAIFMGILAYSALVRSKVLVPETSPEKFLGSIYAIEEIEDEQPADDADFQGDGTDTAASGSLDTYWNTAG